MRKGQGKVEPKETPPTHNGLLFSRPQFTFCKEGHWLARKKQLIFTEHVCARLVQAFCGHLLIHSAKLFMTHLSDLPGSTLTVPGSPVSSAAHTQRAACPRPSVTGPLPPHVPQSSCRSTGKPIPQDLQEESTLASGRLPAFHCQVKIESVVMLL